MACFKCTKGDYAVVRWCEVIKYATDIKVKDPCIKRTTLKFETERRRGTDVIKYDVVPLQWVVCNGKGTNFEQLPPYIYPDFSEMSWPPAADIKKYIMVDAAFFT